MKTVIYQISNWLVDINSLIRPNVFTDISGILSFQLLHVPISEIQIRRHILVKWLPPTYGNIKLNIDRDFKGNPSAAGGGWGIFRDHNGYLIFALLENLEVDTKNHAEMSAFFFGLLYCFYMNNFTVHIEIDSNLLVQWFNKKASSP